mmetsp:Transcript_17803/g.22410  ORF Transcript_17803/g.22410 Transcript_17803/m.22410 type:complete len:301 (-) Transcript_17803:58-960(-)
MGSVISCAQHPKNEAIANYNCAEAKTVHDNVNLWLFLPILMLIYVPLVWIRDMRKLAWSHLLSNILIAVVLISVIIYASDNLAKDGPTLNPLIEASSSYTAISYASGSFEGIAVLMPMRLVVQDRKNFFKHVAIVCTSVCTLYIIFSEYMNVAYGSMEKIKLITDALPATSTVTYSIKALFTCSLFFTYPLQIAPAVNLIEGWIFDSSSQPTKSRRWKQNAIRTGIVLFTIVLAIVVYPFIPLFIEFVGSATCAPLAYSLPALFHYKLEGGNKCHLAIFITTVILAIFLVTMIFVDLALK